MYKNDKRGHNYLKNTKISCFFKMHALFFGQRPNKSYFYTKGKKGNFWAFWAFFKVLYFGKLQSLNSPNILSDA